MIQTQSYLNIVDNTGAKKIMCIRVLGNNKKYAHVGDVIIGVVKQSMPNLAVKKSDIVRAVITRTKSAIKRQDGSYVRFFDNAAIIINNDKNPKGTRVFGPIPRELRERNFTKIISLADEVV